MSEKVENHAIRLLQEMRAELNERIARMETRHDHTDESLFRAIGALTAVANVQEQHSKLLADLPVIKAGVAATKDSCKIIEGRLVRLEKLVGLLPA